MNTVANTSLLRPIKEGGKEKKERESLEEKGKEDKKESYRERRL